MTVAATIRRARETKGWSQELLAREADMSTAAIRKYESGEREPQFRQFIKLCAALGPEFQEAVIVDSADGDKARYLSQPGWPMLLGTTDLVLAHAS
jgi:ribosome-binding protein aMBF1 (putative translation factor)